MHISIFAMHFLFPHSQKRALQNKYFAANGVHNRAWDGAQSWKIEGELREKNAKTITSAFTYAFPRKNEFRPR